MQELLAQLLTYLRMVWRYRWIVVVGSVVTCLAGWMAVISMPDQYEVTAKVYVDNQSILKPLLKGLAVDSAMGAHSAMMMRRTLTTRPNLEKVVRATDMDLNVKSPEEMEMLLDTLESDIVLAGTQKDNIYVIGYRNQSPELARDVVEALLSLFVESALGASRKDTDLTRNFLDEQIHEYETKLAEAEDRLKDFKREHLGMVPGDGENYYGRMRATEDKLRQARLELREGLNQRDELKRQLKKLKTTLSSPDPDNLDAIASPLDQRIQGLETNLDALLLSFTDEHPDVLSTRRVLGLLREKKKQHLMDRKDEGGDDPIQIISNPVYQELKIALGNTQAHVAALRARESEFVSRTDDLRKLVDTVPQVEAELKRVDRDYNIIYGRYHELVQRRESAKLSREAEKSADRIQFNVIEPPHLPLLPIAPDRIKLHTMVLLLGFGVGIGLAITIAQAKPAIYSTQNLKELSGYPVLGTVSFIRNPKQRSRRNLELLVIGAAGAMLLSLFAGLMTLETMNIDLREKLVSIKDRLL